MKLFPAFGIISRMETLSATESYLSMLLALPHLQPITVLAIFFLTLARVLPIVVIAPFMGAKNLPMPVRMMFSLALVVIFLPHNLLTVHQNLPFNMLFAFLAVKELGIGMILGFIASVPFFIAQSAGTLIDHQRGSSALQVTDPTTQTQTSPIGILYNYILLVVFFNLNGPFIFFDGVARSYTLFPVNKFMNTTFFNINLPFWKLVIGLFSHIMTLAIQIAAPALIGLMLTDMFLGIANRLAPQVQIVFLGISLKSWVGIAMMTAAWILILQVIGKESIVWMKALNRIIEQIGFTNALKS